MADDREYKSLISISKIRMTIAQIGPSLLSDAEVFVMRQRIVIRIVLQELFSFHNLPSVCHLQPDQIRGHCYHYSSRAEDMIFINQVWDKDHNICPV